MKPMGFYLLLFDPISCRLSGILRDGYLTDRLNLICLRVIT